MADGSRWSARTDVPRGDDYDRRWRDLEASGASIHGEADLVERLLAEHGRPAPARILDAGCGTGRVAIELARRGHHVVGIDLDAEMLATAGAKAPDLDWTLGDLATVRFDAAFDLIVMAGNVMIFVAPGSEPDVLTNMAAHLEPGGLLVAGFQCGPGRLSPDRYDTHAAEAGLDAVALLATWDGDAFDGGDYVVAVHRRP